MTKEQFREVAMLLAKVKAEVENIMEGDVDFTIWRSHNKVSLDIVAGEKLFSYWLEDGADVEDGEIHEIFGSMWIKREEEF